MLNNYETKKVKKDVLEYLEQPNEIIQKARPMEIGDKGQTNGTNTV